MNRFAEKQDRPKRKRHSNEITNTKYYNKKVQQECVHKYPKRSKAEKITYHTQQGWESDELGPSVLLLPGRCPQHSRTLHRPPH